MLRRGCVLAEKPGAPGDLAPRLNLAAHQPSAGQTAAHALAPDLSARPFPSSTAVVVVAEWGFVSVVAVPAALRTTLCPLV